MALHNFRSRQLHKTLNAENLSIGFRYTYAFRKVSMEPAACLPTRGTAIPLQIMDWCRSGDKALAEPMTTQFPDVSSYDVTKPQCVLSVLCNWMTYIFISSILTQLDPVYVTELGHHWLWQWLVACSAHRHYWNQRWLSLTHLSLD